MDEAAVVAEGIDSTVSLVGDKVVVRRRGMKTLLQRGLSLYRDPREPGPGVRRPEQEGGDRRPGREQGAGQGHRRRREEAGLGAEDAGGLGRAGWPTP